MSEEDYTYVTFHCHTCDNQNCPFCPLGTAVTDDDLRGCTRRMEAVGRAKMTHLIEETLPFCRTFRERAEVLDGILRLEDEAYRNPIGSLLDSKKGKKITSKRIQKSIDDYNNSLPTA